MVGLGLVLLLLVVGSVRSLNRAVDTASAAEAAEEVVREGDRLIKELELVFIRQARAEREMSRLLVRKAELTARRPRRLDYRSRLVALDGQIESVDSDLETYDLTLRRLSLKAQELYGTP